ncbi:MAG: carbohydrate ABC transporter permease, partial [Clostridia bacterium]
MLYPFLNVIAVAFSEYTAYLKNPLMIIPSDFTLSAFRFVFKDNQVIQSYVNTIIVSVSGVAIGLSLIILMAYPLSRHHLKGRAFIMTLVVFSMMFSGGMIPNYYLIRSLKLLDSLWAVILPGAFSAYNMILMKNFLEALPDSLMEAASIDGASEPLILVRIALPLCMPILATLCLFIAVQYWNGYFSAMLYLRDRTKWTLQLVLREIVLANVQNGNNDPAQENYVVSISIKYASLLVVMLPIMLVYPFLQKYFVKGVMIGAVKG